MSESFSGRLKSLRGAMNKADFARSLRIPAPMYQRYEQGQVPKEKNLRVIADHCGVTIGWLLGAEDSPGPPVTPPLYAQGKSSGRMVARDVDTDTRMKRLEEHCAAAEKRLASIERLLLRLLAEEDRGGVQDGGGKPGQQRAG